MHYSQLGQDELVDALLQQKTGGYYVELGCSHAEAFSNSCFFERSRGWSGVGVDHLEKYQLEWAQLRTGVFCLADALEIDYQKLFDGLNAPSVIDYLSIDVDPPLISYQTLLKVFDSDRKFRVITFETDYGGDVECNFTRFSTRDPSRAFLLEKGYTMVQEIYDRGKPWYLVDDLWYNPNI
jgi:hypothetical protein